MLHCNFKGVSQIMEKGRHTLLKLEYYSHATFNSWCSKISHSGMSTSQWLRCHLGYTAWKPADDSGTWVPTTLAGDSKWDVGRWSFAVCLSFSRHWESGPMQEGLYFCLLLSVSLPLKEQKFYIQKVKIQSNNWTSVGIYAFLSRGRLTVRRSKTPRSTT